MDATTFFDRFATIVDAPGGLRRLRDLVMDLAVSGRLVDQDPEEEPATHIIRESADALPTARQGGRRSRTSDATPDAPDSLFLPDSWLQVTAAQLGHLIRGVTYPKTAASDVKTKGTVPLLRAHNIDGIINYEKLVHVAAELVSHDQRLIPGDHLICMSSGSARLVGKSAVVTRDDIFGFGAFCSVFRPAVPSVSRYIGVYLQSPTYRQRVCLLSRGIGINNLRASDIEQLVIPLPPLAEQERIVAKVDELTGLCDELEVRQERRHCATTRFRGSALHAVTDAGTPEELRRAWGRVSTYWPALTAHPDSMVELRATVIQLALCGRLVDQDVHDEPVQSLLAKVKLRRDSLPKRRGPQPGNESESQRQETPSGRHLPPGWAETRLGDISEIVRGITFPAAAKHTTGGSDLVPCLRTTNVQETVEWHDLIFVPNQYVKNESQFVRSGDLLMSMANSRELVGKLALVGPEPPRAAFGGFLAAIRPLIISPRFLQLVLQDPRAKATLIDSATQTTNIANISLGRLRPFRCPLPPLAEQRRIVSRVDELMGLCDELESALATQSGVAVLLASSITAQINQL
ncbi:MAG TPA: restriction endonuclease subunit S [Acidimicrobiales bacterium]|nr:restriction endonuclease subunit S [Acidimicrobiales bacterium]